MEKKNKKLIQAFDLQDTYGFSRCRSYQIMNDPTLPVVQIGRRKYVLEDAFEEWLAQKTKAGRGKKVTPGD